MLSMIIRSLYSSGIQIIYSGEIALETGVRALDVSVYDNDRQYGFI